VTGAEVSVTGVVAALRSEARCLPPNARHLRVQASGMGAERAARTAQGLASEGVGALLCFGVAGALDPGLRCGDVILASEVICAQPLALQLPGMRPAALPGSARIRTSERWRAALAAALLREGSVLQAPLLTSSELICDTQQKRRLYRQTGAVAVDMESAAVGVVANLHGLPFMVLRVVADTAQDALPEVLRQLVAAQPPGASEWVSWLQLLGAPGAWPGLLRMARRYQHARAVLRHCGQLARREIRPPA